MKVNLVLQGIATETLGVKAVGDMLKKNWLAGIYRSSHRTLIGSFVRKLE
jgi:hypothetical protein